MGGSPPRRHEESPPSPVAGTKKSGRISLHLSASIYESPAVNLVHNAIISRYIVRSSNSKLMIGPSDGVLTIRGKERERAGAACREAGQDGNISVLDWILV